MVHFDFGAGTKLTIGQARKQSALNRRSWPDLLIASPVFYPHTVTAGLFIELKRVGTRLRKRDGSWATGHIAEQADTLERLRSAGYVAEFGVGFDDCIRIITEYVAPYKGPGRAAPRSWCRGPPKGPTKRRQEPGLPF